MLAHGGQGQVLATTNERVIFMGSLSNSTTTRDDVILDVLRSLKRTLYNYAIAYGLDVEDLMQESVITMLETWDRVPQCANPSAYLYVVVKRRLSSLIPQDAPISLDAPIADTYLTLGDTIPANDTQQIDYTYTDYVTRVVHWAIRQLPPEVQLYAVETFGMSGYQMLKHSKKIQEQVQSVYSARRKSDMKRELKKALQCNPAVLDLFTPKRRKYSRVR